MALISIKDLSLSFGGPPLLDRVELHIEEGDRLCLLGRNGTGKSTLLKLIAGDLKPDSGEITWRKGLVAAYLPQDSRPQEQGTLIDLVLEQAESRLSAEQALSLFDLDPDREIGSLSGGERRRVYLARTVATGAEVLLLDEPTNHLDIDTIAALEEYLLRRVKTLLFVTHDRSFAKNLANRVAEIDRGSLYAFRTDYESFLERREQMIE
ncbi:MAG TPA: ABC-F family ATP-binding cassette domain-containing protein, partial [Sediminispirochaeta sp.]|nr:ABC-F family ATP-binding cassette domain-containing protein [Sediminispirochaeta sp.]